MECLETRRLFAFAQGELDAEATRQVEQHLDSCASCRALVAEAARAEDGEASPPSPASLSPTGPALSWLERGALLGRYVVLERIGAGGMGVVHAAYDPELDRRVALKLIRVDSTTPAHLERAQARLLREAQATARVIHPNVITIHDVGRFGEHVFLAMELVDGTTLRVHIRARKERGNWRETLNLFIQAGRGLAAAHAQGLVHRDFKPDNALVGKDGRVRITDFGLARIIEGIDDTPTPPGSTAPAPLRSEWHTRSDMVLGTPAYMSPEQKRGEPSDARSDQYSFCVALHEALYGQRPFATQAVAKTTPDASRAAPGPRPPQGSDVPAWVHQVILRGLSAEPEARHESMEALLRGLSRAPGETWRRAVLAASAGLLLLAGGAALHRSTSGDPCAGSEQALIGVWDPARKGAVRTVFTGSALPYAAGAWSEVEHTLDGYAGNWVAASHEACVATRVKGQQTERLLERRVICLDQRLKDLGAVADTLATGDKQVIQNASRMVHGLENLSVCANLSALAAPEPPPTDEASQKHMEAIRSQRAQVRARLTAGQVAPALKLATEVAREAHALGYGPLEAEVLDLLAESQGKNLAHREGVKTLHQAIQVATASRHDRQAAESWAGMIRLLSLVGPEVDPDGMAPGHAEAALRRLGGDAHIEARYFRNLASLHRVRGRREEALAASERAVELARKLYTENDPELGTALLTMGHALYEFQRHSEGLRYLLQAEAVYRKTYGPDHPYLATVLSNLAVFSVRLGDHESALKYGRESLKINARVYGEESEPTASVYFNLGGFLMEAGRPEESIQHYEKAVRIRDKVQGTEHADLVVPLSKMGEVQASVGRFDEALKTHQRALAIAEKTSGPDSSFVARDLKCLGEDYLGLQQPRKALPLLERAVLLFERLKSEKDRDHQADARFALAQALVSTSGDTQRALRLATAAQAYNQGDLKSREHEFKTVTQWLTAHGAPDSH